MQFRACEMCWEPIWWTNVEVVISVCALLLTMSWISLYYNQPQKYKSGNIHLLLASVAVLKHNGGSHGCRPSRQPPQTIRKDEPVVIISPSLWVLQPFTFISSSLSVSSCHGIDLWLLCGIRVWDVPLTLSSRGIGNGVRQVCLQGVWKDFQCLGRSRLTFSVGYLMLPAFVCGWRSVVGGPLSYWAEIKC